MLPEFMCNSRIEAPEPVWELRARSYRVRAYLELTLPIRCAREHATASKNDSLPNGYADHWAGNSCIGINRDKDFGRRKDGK
jgi:hypothetical protein